ncbi:ABC transporter substrate-binding protein [Protaetiibacter sp. SSC-01]|uniref:ABC transporter substrate-binding protein n=1 Tax=Protaetiibacter sp. SSC-01 TaxID=2759943 RepID=UPI00165711B6|nr:ABC transporter substrate-binding protein [Protaetiibacter sp. SSC-01]QNO37823.1 ABC transporter substrate-binding protein [Protaetiibacter sp. SSC-01]
MSVTRRSLGAIAIAVSALLTLGACANTGSDGAPLAEQQDLKVGLASLPINLDVLQNSAEGKIIGPMQHVLEPLVKRDGDSFEPWLAESWENPDDLTWVFTIRSDVKFSDGTVLTAEDARASLRRLIDTESPLAPLLAAVENIEATDDSTLTIETKTPLGTLLTTLSQILIGQGAVINDEAYWAKPIGTGPFVIDEFVADQRFALSRNDDYWGPETKLDTITYIGMPEEAARISALSTGEVDIIDGVSPDAIPEVQSLDSVTFESVPSYAIQYIWFNSSREPYTDVRVRQALWHALDLEQIVSDLYGDQASVAQAPVPQAVFGAAKLEPYTYDPELAKELLAEAGYPDGFSTTMQFSSSTGVPPFMQTVISYWAEIGVTVEPLPKEQAIWLDDLLALNWDMNVQSPSVTSGDADYHLGRLYVSSANRLGYANPEYDALVTAARESVDQQERISLYAEASKILWEDAPAIWAADQTANVAYRDYVTGVTIDAGNRNDYSAVVLRAK